MTVFRKSVSWSKFNLALTCPLRLQKTIDKEYSPKFGVNSTAAATGKLVQKVFELYFNNQFNLKDNGLRVEVLVKILDKVLKSKFAQDEGIDDTFREPSLPQLERGFALFRENGFMNYRVKSEVSMAVTYAGFRMFGMLDFLIEQPTGYVLLDGKGNAAKDADPLQLKYYALMVNSSTGRDVTGGFVYWKHDYDRVDLSTKSLWEFTHNEFAQGRKIFEQLQHGVQELPANPSKSNCHWCHWKNNCAKSAYQKPPSDPEPGLKSIGFLP